LADNITETKKPEHFQAREFYDAAKNVRNIRVSENPHISQPKISRVTEDHNNPADTNSRICKFKPVRVIMQ
jgi:hypothetical protein